MDDKICWTVDGRRFNNKNYEFTLENYQKEAKSEIFPHLGHIKISLKYGNVLTDLIMDSDQMRYFDVILEEMIERVVEYSYRTNKDIKTVDLRRRKKVKQGHEFRTF